MAVRQRPQATAQERRRYPRGPPGPAGVEAIGRQLPPGSDPYALAALVRAAANATAESAPAEALRHLSQALNLWDRLPDPVVVAGVDQGDLLVRAAEAAADSGESSRAVSLAREAVDAIDADAEPLRAALAHERLGRYLLDACTMEGSADEMLDTYRKAVELVPEAPPTPLRALVVAGLADALLVARRYDEVLCWCDEALAVARRLEVATTRPAC